MRIPACPRLTLVKNWLTVDVGPMWELAKPTDQMRIVVLVTAAIAGHQ